MSDRVQRHGAGQDLDPPGYAELLTSLKAEVRAANVRAHRVVNTELLTVYWTIGRAIRDRQAAEGWGTRVINRLADDLRAEFPSQRGFGRSNLKYMRQAAAAWPGPNWPTGCWPIAVGTHHRPAGQARRSG